MICRDAILRVFFVYTQIMSWVVIAKDLKMKGHVDGQLLRTSSQRGYLHSLLLQSFFC
jgi:hypothetical protein